MAALTSSDLADRLEADGNPAFADAVRALRMLTHTTAAAALPMLERTFGLRSAVYERANSIVHLGTFGGPGSPHRGG